ncbi:MAG: hypothetical protein IJC15_01720 [Clostridia bacterium]|nr:hypothetical protein [Clostridia bacterium]
MLAIGTKSGLLLLGQLAVNTASRYPIVRRDRHRHAGKQDREKVRKSPRLGQCLAGRFDFIQNGQPLGAGGEQRLFDQRCFRLGNALVQSFHVTSSEQTHDNDAPHRHGRTEDSAAGEALAEAEDRGCRRRRASEGMPLSASDLRLARRTARMTASVRAAGQYIADHRADKLSSL